MMDYRKLENSGMWVVYEEWHAPFAMTYIEDNARVIAAAPEMLEALKISNKALELAWPWLVNENGMVPTEIYEAMTLAKEAITKAEGKQQP